MRAPPLLLLSVTLAALVACVRTTFDPAHDPVPRPTAKPDPRQRPAAVLGSAFDPFDAYGEKVEVTAPQGGHEAPASATPAFTCSMHPEIVRDSPGACPVCGMKLVPKKPAPTRPAH